MTEEVAYLDDQILVKEETEDTLADIVAVYGEEFVRKYFVSNLRYRNKHPRVYKKASAELVPFLSLKFKTQPGTEKKIYEKPLDHLHRCYKKNAELTTAVISKFAQSEPLYVKGDRTGVGGKISQTAIDNANTFFAEGDDVVEGKVLTIEALVPNYKVERDEQNAVTPDGLARGIQMLSNHLDRQAKETAKLKRQELIGGKI